MFEVMGVLGSKHLTTFLNSITFQTSSIIRQVGRNIDLVWTFPVVICLPRHRAANLILLLLVHTTTST